MPSGNINQYVKPNYNLKMSLESFDMFLVSDEKNFQEEVVFSPFIIAQTWGNKLPISFDINNTDSVQDISLNYGEYNPNNVFVSLNYYNPKDEDLSCYSSNTLCDIGLTGIDNGLVNSMIGEELYYTKGLYNDFYKFNRMYYDRRMKMIQVTGHTGSPNVRFSGFDKTILYEVVSKNNPYEGNYQELYGGFYQGFYKLFGYDYEVFPERTNKGWSVEMLLKPRLTNEYTPTSGQTTLNEIYPNNKNTFFYFGTRAENKFYHYADGSPSSLSGYTRVTSGLEECMQSCMCCETGVTISRCVYAYPPRSVNGKHDPHQNYGCPKCGTINTGTTTTCSGETNSTSCGCSVVDVCVNCGWECKKHNCDIFFCLTNDFEYDFSATTDGPHTSSGGTGTTQTLELTSIQNTCETDPIYDSISNALSFKLSGDPQNPKICVRVLRFTGGCETTGSCETTGLTFSTGYTIQEFCSPKTIYDYCYNINTGFTLEERWFHITAVWERYSYFDDCDLGPKGGLYDITKKFYLESLANNTIALITTPYTQTGTTPAEQVELVNLNLKWIEHKNYRNGRLIFYINGVKFFVIENFEELIPRGLNTDKEKQIGVPFNISWGGGTLGLRENLTYSSCTTPQGPYIQDPECFPINDLSGTTLSGLSTNILIEQNFAGSFEGGISQFRMYVEPLTASEIKHNFNILKNNFNMYNPECPDCENISCEINDFEYISCDASNDFRYIL